MVKKRSFLVPVAVAIAALSASTVPSATASTSEVRVPASSIGDLVLAPAPATETGVQLASHYSHESHASHVSHESHSSHSSHYSGY